MTGTKYWQYDADGKLIEGERVTAIDPVATEQAGEKRFFPVPVNGTTIQPPEEREGHDIVWDGTGWSYRQNEQKTEPASITQPTEDASMQEMEELQTYLDETDYKVIKCLELGLDIDKEYPGVRTSRQNARVRIRALRDNANR